MAQLLAHVHPLSWLLLGFLLGQSVMLWYWRRKASSPDGPPRPASRAPKPLQPLKPATGRLVLLSENERSLPTNGGRDLHELPRLIA